MELLESLLFVLGPMLDQLLLRAQDRSFALASVTVGLALEGGGEHQRTLKPALPVLERDGAAAAAAPGFAGASSAGGQWWAFS